MWTLPIRQMMKNLPLVLLWPFLVTNWMKLTTCHYTLFPLSHRTSVQLQSILWGTLHHKIWQLPTTHHFQTMNNWLQYHQTYHPSYMILPPYCLPMTYVLWPSPLFLKNLNPNEQRRLQAKNPKLQRELQDLYSSINYDKTTTLTIREGSSIDQWNFFHGTFVESTFGGNILWLKSSFNNKTRV